MSIKRSRTVSMGEGSCLEKFPMETLRDYVIPFLNPFEALLLSKTCRSLAGVHGMYPRETLERVVKRTLGEGVDFRTIPMATLTCMALHVCPHCGSTGGVLIQSSDTGYFGHSRCVSHSVLFKMWVQDPIQKTLRFLPDLSRASLGDPGPGLMVFGEYGVTPLTPNPMRTAQYLFNGGVSPQNSSVYNESCKRLLKTIAHVEQVRSVEDYFSTHQPIVYVSKNFRFNVYVLFKDSRVLYAQPNAIEFLKRITEELRLYCKQMASWLATYVMPTLKAFTRIGGTWSDLVMDMLGFNRVEFKLQLRKAVLAGRIDGFTHLVSASLKRYVVRKLKAEAISSVEGQFMTTCSCPECAMWAMNFTKGLKDAMDSDSKLVEVAALPTSRHLGFIRQVERVFSTATMIRKSLREEGREINSKATKAVVEILYKVIMGHVVGVDLDDVANILIHAVKVHTGSSIIKTFRRYGVDALRV